MSNPTLAKVQVCLLPLASPKLLTERRKKLAGQVAGAAFATDSLFRWLRPRTIPDYHEQLCLYFEERVRKVVANAETGEEVVLAFKKAEGDEEQQMVGLAIWKGVSIDMGVRERRATADQAQSEPSTQAAASPQDPALDESRLADFSAAWDATDKAVNQVLASGKPVTVNIEELKSRPPSESPPDFPHIELSLMAVTPEYQGKAVGSALLDWGVRCGDKLGVPIVIGTSDAGRLLYCRRGFSDLGVRIEYASEEDEKAYGRLNDDLVVRWPPGASQKG